MRANREILKKVGERSTAGASDLIQGGGKMAGIVLVHGAWSGSWSWREVTRHLRAKGHEVFAPTLTGLAERSHIDPRHVNLSSHVADIAGLMHWNDLTEVVLVGHSY